MSLHPPAVRFSGVVLVEVMKLRRSLALVLAAVAPGLVAVFLFFNLLRLHAPMPWSMALMSSAAIWAFFMLPMSLTALTALVAHADHGPRSWEHLRALPLPGWQLYAAKLACVLGLLLGMSALLALATPLALMAASAIHPEAAPSGPLDYPAYLQLLGRIALSACLLVVVQLWVALRYASFVPGLALGIAGTFFAVVATSAKVGVVLPWQIPVNQLATDPARADLALLIGLAGGLVGCVLMPWRLGRRETL
ncbi:ABC transporter permease [Pseudomarimonas salicorniae]|uniref:ABC transporter permease n=1 Tax=Pseudomarimonas salicorniae TaxID=2933270 RepID=A0ABT0GLB0_9GAMM|nr:ABC transporter permease [Lysobacter sp. CAU 1642]MCK7594837.1 ABC transporter permease [Lysobacter sp. CAU 1642]